MNLETTRLRPRNRCQDEVKKDGRPAGGIGWREIIHNREEWKKILRTAMNRRILHMAVNELLNVSEVCQVVSVSGHGNFPSIVSIVLPSIFFNTSYPIVGC